MAFPYMYIILEIPVIIRNNYLRQYLPCIEFTWSYHSIFCVLHDITACGSSHPFLKYSHVPPVGVANYDIITVKGNFHNILTLHVRPSEFISA